MPEQPTKHLKLDARPDHFSIRPAGIGDARLIQQFIRREQLNPFGLDWQRFTVAVTETGRVIGCIQYKPHRRDTVELASLVVEPEWRGKGVGRALVQHLQQEQGPPMWLMCAGRTAGYYTPFGFERVEKLSEMPLYFRTIAGAFRLVQPFLQPDERLTIMVWREPPASPPASPEHL